MFCSILFFTLPAHADDALSLSGRLNARGGERQEKDSVKEDPSLEGRLKLDASASSWRLHSWLEGGWDGTVLRPPRDRSLFKNYDEVYQSNSPYLEFKELCLTHTSGSLDLRAGIQRFAWGRLDEYPPNDVLNPWDYTQFLRKPLEDRKIGVPSVSATLNRGDWSLDAVWIPVLVPYRLAMPDERWSGSSIASTIHSALPNAVITPREPDLPDRKFENGNAGLRIKHLGDIEWALNLYNGYDLNPVFKGTAFTLLPQGSSVTIDPGYVPDFHRMSSVGMDAAVVRGDLSIRAEARYAFHRYLNIRHELWGYPAVLTPGIHPLSAIEREHDTVDYGIGLDYRLFEDAMLTAQVQQTAIIGNVDLLYERKFETLLWANVKINWMNQKIETNLNVAYNPEHNSSMVKANAWYVFSDSWKAGIAAINLN
ncbi:MAG TPA: DUF1302 family protein, partial [Nitrospirota bacterium]|nr:DUF1302 family protein [Nitrospirota bacterium]